MKYDLTRKTAFFQHSYYDANEYVLLLEAPEVAVVQTTGTDAESE